MSFREPFEHREVLLSAAIDAFVAHGFDGASLNAILARAGVSKGQFYHHFQDKEALYLGVIEALVERKRAWFVAHPVPPAADPFSALTALVRAGLAFARANPDLDAFGRSFLRERGRPIFTTALARFSAGDAPGVREAVARGALSGAFRADLSAAFIGRAIGLVLQNLPELLDLSAPEELEGRLGELERFLRGGLGQGAVPPVPGAEGPP